MNDKHTTEKDPIAERYEQVLRLRFPPTRGDLWFEEFADRLAGIAKDMIRTAVEDMHAHADVLADQRNAAIRHGRVPAPDDNHTSDGRCKYPATCASGNPTSPD